MQAKRYVIQKVKKGAEKIKFSLKKMEGFRVTPHNRVTHPGITVNSMLLIKPSLIEKVLKRKNQRKLDYYLQYIISLMDNNEDTDDDSAFRVALNDLTRYREMVEYKYRKFLDDKYIHLLLKKIDLLEHEIKSKMIFKQQLKSYQTYQSMEEEKEKTGKSR